MTVDPPSRALGRLHGLTRLGRALDEKTTVLVHLASALAVACCPPMVEYAGAARRQGVTDDEFDAVRAIVATVQAGRVRVESRGGPGAPQQPPAGKTANRISAPQPPARLGVLRLPA